MWQSYQQIHRFKEGKEVDRWWVPGEVRGQETNLNTWQVGLGTVIGTPIRWKAMVRNCRQATVSKMVGEVVFLLRCGFDEQAAKGDLKAASILWAPDSSLKHCFINFCTSLCLCNFIMYNVITFSFLYIHQIGFLYFEQVLPTCIPL